MQICYGHRLRERTSRQHMMLKKERMMQFQLEHQVLLDETVKRNGCCGQFERNAQSRDTNKSIRTRLAMHDSYHWFAAEEDGDRSATYKEMMKIKYKNE